MKGSKMAPVLDVFPETDVYSVFAEMMCLMREDEETLEYEVMIHGTVIAQSVNEASDIAWRMLKAEALKKDGCIGLTLVSENAMVLPKVFFKKRAFDSLEDHILSVIWQLVEPRKSRV